MAREYPIAWIEESGAWFPAIILESAKSVLVMLEDGSTRQIRRNHIQFESLVEIGADDNELRMYREKVDHALSLVSGQLAELWDLLSTGTSSPKKARYSLDELVSYLGTPSENPFWFDAMRQKIFSGAIHFRKKGEEFELVEAHAVQQRERQEQVRIREEQKLASMVEVLKQDLAATGQVESTHRRSKLQKKAYKLIETIALDRREQRQYDEGIKLLEAIFEVPPGQPRRTAFDLLVRLGEYSPDELLSLREYNISKSFPENIENEATELRKKLSPPIEEETLDLLPITIDDAHTLDRDDAIALEEKGDHDVVHIMITDVAGYLEPGSALIHEAAERSSSIYLPTQTIPMLPKALSEDALSLKESTPQNVMDFQIRMDKEGAPLDIQIAMRSIRVAHTLSYDEADAILSKAEGEGSDALNQTLIRLKEISEKLREQRSRRGAFLWSMGEYKVHISGHGVDITEINTSSPSRTLVQEFMILAGWMSANFCISRQIPIIFRTQRSSGTQLETHNPTLSEIFSQVITMTPASIGVTPSPHEGLGVPAYIQITSPLRRFQDYLCQTQIRTHITSGSAAFSESELLERFSSLEEKNRINRTIMRGAKAYWTLKYYAQREGEKVQVIVLHTWGRKARLGFPETGYQMDWHSERELEPGTILTCLILGAEPREEKIQIRLL